MLSLRRHHLFYFVAFYCFCLRAEEGQDEYEKDGFIVDDVEEEQQDEEEEEGDSDEGEKHKKKKRRKR